MKAVVTRDSEPLLIAGRRVAAHLRARVPALTRHVVAELREELPVYAELPHEEITGDIADIVQYNLRLFADVLERRRSARDDELARQRDSAAQRAEEGVPLDAILSAYQIGITMAWREISAGARPYDLDALQETLGLVMCFQRQVIAAVSGAYLEARQILDSQDHGGRHALMTALLAGDPLDHVAQRPAALYIAMTLSLPPHPDENDPGPRGRIAARRKIRRVRLALDRFAKEPALTALDSSGGTALLPVVARPDWNELQEIIGRASTVAGTPIIAGAADAAPPGIPAAVAQTAEIVDVVRRTGRPPGLYRLADVLLDYQLSRPSQALTELAALLLPLDDRPELLHTLRTYLAYDLDRRRTGAELHIHPNTVDYRIRRISRLTGLSPSRQADLHHLNAALIARNTLNGDTLTHWTNGESA